MTNDAEAPDGDAPITVFLSYASEDRAQARRLASALASSGYTVWWDAMIEGGATFTSSIAEALDKADAIIVLWSRSSVDSDWVRDEASQGRERHRLVPLTIDRTKAPLGFRQYQVIDLSKWRGRANAPQFQAVVRAIHASTGRKELPRAVRRRGLSRRTMIAGGAAAGLALAGGGVILADKKGLFGPKRSDAIAVLPFKNLSGDAAQDYLSEGLTDEVRAALVRNNLLRVLAGTSSSTERAENENAADFAQRLGVTYLLDGSVRRAGDMVRISAILTDGRTGFDLWSKTLDHRMSDIFGIEDEIARSVAEALQIRMATARPAPGGTHNVAAYESYLRGKSLFNQAKDEATDRQALAAFDLAIAADPNFAMAYAARARSLASIANNYVAANQLKPLYDQSIAAARRSVEIAPDLAEANLALGYALYVGRLDVKGARPYYDRAAELGRGNADILLLFALYCSRAGRAGDATEAIERAILLDPLNPRAHRAAGSIDYSARRYARAIPPLRRALQLNPKITNAHGLIGDSLMQMGRLAEARKEFEAEPLPFMRLTGLAIAAWRIGDRAAAQRAFDQLVAELGDSAFYQQAEVLAQWGRADDSIVRLQRARQVGDSGLIYLATDPLLDPIRRHPRFRLLLKELNVL
jgi:TolB-like protein/Tfp pilus assembly protein PilF